MQKWVRHRGRGYGRRKRYQYKEVGDKKMFDDTSSFLYFIWFFWGCVMLAQIGVNQFRSSQPYDITVTLTDDILGEPTD